VKILITGGTGFLGRHTALYFQKAGAEVTILGRNKKRGEEIAQNGIQFIPVDLSDSELTKPLCKNIDVVIHCASLSSPWGSYQDFYSANIQATQNILQSCILHQVKRFIHISTPSIYFNFQDRLLISEKDPLPQKMVNFYALTKLKAEQEVDQFAQKYSLPTITLRPRAIFGEYDQTIMPRLIRVAKKGRFPLINGGNATLDLTYVENVVDAIQLAVSASSSCFGKKYNITNGQPIVLKNLLKEVFQTLNIPFHPKTISYFVTLQVAGAMELFAKLTRKEPSLTKYSVGVLAKSQTLDISLAKKELGYNPQITIEEGIQRYGNWYKKQL
jgi:nucleoside-diphosphate-sugar epimerase